MLVKLFRQCKTATKWATNAKHTAKKAKYDSTIFGDCHIIVTIFKKVKKNSRSVYAITLPVKEKKKIVFLYHAEALTYTSADAIAKIHKVLFYLI